MAYSVSLAIFALMMLGLSWRDPVARSWMVRQWAQVGASSGSGDTSQVSAVSDTSVTGDTTPTAPSKVEATAWGYYDLSDLSIIEFDAPETATARTADEVVEWLRRESAGGASRADLEKRALKELGISESTFDRRYRAAGLAKGGKR
jgi:hypothetical protein